ncbi:MAG: hypothetical protein IKA58_03650, partial [Clostridia bacterium]|nr:hypothetical protein [Clostridia bacterium]
FDIGEEANQRVDFEGMQADLLAQQAKQRAAKTRRIRYMGMAAACVIVLGVASMLPGGLNKPAAEAAPAPMEYAVETEEAAPAAEAPAAEERIVDINPGALDVAVANGCDSCTVEEAVAEEAPVEEAIAEEEAAEEAAPAGGASGADACLVNADTGVFEIGIPKEGFEEYLKDNYYGIIVIPFEKSGIPEGSADISVTLCENTAVWNTGSGVYYVEIQAVGSAEEFADILRTACQ